MRKKLQKKKNLFFQFSLSLLVQKMSTLSPWRSPISQISDDIQHLSRHPKNVEKMSKTEIFSQTTIFRLQNQIPSITSTPQNTVTSSQLKPVKFNLIQ
jgi:hypothetical protein